MRSVPSEQANAIARGCQLPQRATGVCGRRDDLPGSYATVHNVGYDVSSRGSCPRGIVEVKGARHRDHLDFGIRRQSSRVVFR